MPLINRVIDGRCPTGIAPISLSDDNEEHKKNTTLKKGVKKWQDNVNIFTLVMDRALLLLQQKLTPF